MSVFSAGSLHLRRELAYACRILAANGQNDTVYGHVTYREAGAQTFWMKPSTLGLDEITPETLICVDLEGNIVEGELPRHLEFPIHAEILRTRPTITCVVPYPPHLLDRLCRYRRAITCCLTRRSAVHTARCPSLHTNLRSDHHSRTGRGSRSHDGWKSCLLPDQPRDCRSWQHDRPGGRLSHQFRASQPSSTSCRCIWSFLSLDKR